MAKKNWIQKARARMEKKGTAGAFGRQAAKRGMSACQFAREVLSNKSKYGARTVKRALFARNTGCRKKR